MAELLFPCPSCSRQLRLKASSSGQQIRCPKCGAVFTAPAPRTDLDKEKETLQDSTLPDQLEFTLQDPNDDVRRAALVSLAALGPRAAAAVPDLRLVAAAVDDPVRRTAVLALEWITAGATAKSPPTGGPTSPARTGGSTNSEVAALISQLGRRDLLGPPTHWQKLLDLGERAVPHLLPLLDGDKVNVVADAAKLLGQLGAKQAIPKLQTLSNSRWAEVQQACTTALAMLDSNRASGLRLDRQSPYQQIAKLWTAIFQGRQSLYPPEVLHAWCVETIAAMPSLAIPEDKKAQAWSMLGSLCYKSVRPEWDGSPSSVTPCPEAKKCYQEAVCLDSGVDHWNRLAQSF